MAELVPAIHVLSLNPYDVEARHKAGHDEDESIGMTLTPTGFLTIGSSELEYRMVGGYSIGAFASATWMDVGTPWAVFTVEDIVLNANVNDFVRARGQ